jgi:hypothetical protein
MSRVFYLGGDGARRILSGLLKDVFEQIATEFAIVLHEVHKIIDDLSVAFIEGLELNSAAFLIFPNYSAGHFSAAIADHEFNDHFIAWREFKGLGFQEGATQRDVFQYSFGVLAAIALAVFNLHL